MPGEGRLPSCSSPLVPHRRRLLLGIGCGKICVGWSCSSPLAPHRRHLLLGTGCGQISVGRSCSSLLAPHRHHLLNTVCGRICVGHAAAAGSRSPTEERKQVLVVDGSGYLGQHLLAVLASTVEGFTQQLSHLRVFRCWNLQVIDKKRSEKHANNEDLGLAPCAVGKSTIMLVLTLHPLCKILRLLI
ncbi:unnamed protein product [Urochloa humidicola]